jgi:hypothetical protein
VRRQIELLSVVVEQLPTKTTTMSLQYFNQFWPANNMMVESKVAVVMSSAAWWCQVHKNKDTILSSA